MKNDLLAFRKKGSIFGFSVEDSFTGIELIVFLKKTSCDCPKCKDENRKLTDEQEIEIFFKEQIEEGEKTLEEVENSTFFQLTFGEYCTLAMTIQSHSELPYPLPLEVFLPILFSDKQEIVDFCLNKSPVLQSELTKKLVLDVIELETGEIDFKEFKERTDYIRNELKLGLNDDDLEQKLRDSISGMFQGGGPLN